jgi:pSer/pThr/pTyr-binding forkhead associated (FHA) protein
MVVFDSGQVHRFVGSCVLGRGPDSGEGVDTLRLPDLSRRLAASHAQVFDTADEAGDAVFEVVDLGSLTGTWLDGGAGEARLAAGEKARVSAGCSVRIGDYRFHLERSE